MIFIKCFSLNEKGDVEIKNNKIVMASNEELMRQKIQKILSTNRGEWFGNENEGINFQDIVGKNVNEEIVKRNILDGLLQIDSTFILSNFSMELDTKTRKLKVSFSAINEENKTVNLETEIGN